MSTDENSKLKISSFGGICAVMEKMRLLEVPELFDQYLGKRVKQARYKFSDIFLGWIYCNLCGAKRLDDINTDNFHAVFNDIPLIKLCSHDQISRAMRLFATPVDKVTSRNKKNITHEFNRNRKMNDLLIAFAKRLGLLNETDTYLIDYDGTIVPTEKDGTKTTYKQCKGYSPGVSMIGKVPVSIEARNGNTTPSYKIKEALDHLFEVLDAHKIKTWGIRMDAASFQKKIIYRLDELKKLFYIRVSNSENMLTDIKVANWRLVEIHAENEEIGEFEFYPFDDEHKFRVVVTKTPNKAPKEVQKKEIIYRAIITNDMAKENGKYKRSDVEVVKVYDMRGDSENNFRDLFNDFNWKRVPFSHMNENLVFLYVSAMAKCLYEYSSASLIPIIPELNHLKLRKFIAKFVKGVTTVLQQDHESWRYSFYYASQKLQALHDWVNSK